VRGHRVRRQEAVRIGQAAKASDGNAFVWRRFQSGVCSGAPENRTNTEAALPATARPGRYTGGLFRPRPRLRARIYYACCRKCCAAAFSCLAAVDGWSTLWPPIAAPVLRPRPSLAIG
jgi:hypothetical protein